jgi:hypothetical protein
MADEFGFVTIDANLSTATVFTDIYEHLSQLLGIDTSSPS